MDAWSADFGLQQTARSQFHVTNNFGIETEPVCGYVRMLEYAIGALELAAGGGLGLWGIAGDHGRGGVSECFFDGAPRGDGSD